MALRCDIRYPLAALLIAAVVACAGGDPITTAPTAGSPSVELVTGRTNIDAPTTPAGSVVVTGTLTDYVTHLPISDASIDLGQQPSYSCFAWIGCGRPIAPHHRVRTQTNGTFRLSGVRSGLYMLRISQPGYTELHQMFSVSHTNVVVTNATISRLSADEAAWLRQLKSDRAHLSVPSSTGNIVFDEGAQEQVRAWTLAVANGTVAYGDPVYTTVLHAPFYAKVAEVGDLAMSWKGAESAWFAERTNCPNLAWLECPWQNNTGHYIILSDSADVWVALSESPQPIKAGLPWAGYFVYGGILLGSLGGYQAP